MYKSFTLLLTITFCLLNNLNAQDLALFIDRSEILSDNSDPVSPFSAFVDINGDYRDDILKLKNRGDLYIDVQSNNGEIFHNQFIRNIEGSAWAVLVGNIDNQGPNEIFTAGSYNGATILSPINNKSEYIITQETNEDFFAQNSNFVDINNDGFLDLFICDDDSLSEIYLNDGTGHMVENNDYIDMRTIPSSDNSGNYSSVWTDVDGDGDLDLYIGKCRLGVQSSLDPRRVNVLYINDNGNFVESAKDFGIDIGAQSWTSNFGDIDNDGDQDLFMINHGSHSMLFENIDNNEFVEIPLFSTAELLITERIPIVFCRL